MSRYSAIASTSLAERLDALSGEPVDQRLSLASEIDVSRLVVERALQHFDKFVLENDLTDEQKAKITPELKAMALRGLQDALQATGALVDKGAKIAAALDDKVTVEHIVFIAAQFGKIMDKHIEDEEIKKKIAEDCKNLAIPDRADMQPNITLRVRE